LVLEKLKNRARRRVFHFFKNFLLRFLIALETSFLKPFPFPPYVKPFPSYWLSKLAKSAKNESLEGLTERYVLNVHFDAATVALVEYSILRATKRAIAQLCNPNRSRVLAVPVGMLVDPSSQKFSQVATFGHFWSKK